MAINKSKGTLVPVKRDKNLPTIQVHQGANGQYITDESFGVEAVIDGRKGMFSIIIPKNSTVPIGKSRRYFPIQDYQTLVRVACFKGEQPVAKNNTKLGEFVVSGLMAREKNDSQGVDIKFTINREGVVLVDAIEVENPRNHLKIKLVYRPPESLLLGIAKGVLKEVAGIFLPAGKK